MASKQAKMLIDSTHHYKGVNMKNLSIIILIGILSKLTIAMEISENDTPSIPYPFPGIPNDDDQANRNCRLLGPFALFIQAIMGFVVVGTLVLKRQREKPKRPWKIWLLDISKQMLGQLFVHSLNVLLSSIGSKTSEGENNPCSLYFLNIAVDTTIGVLFIYYCMRFLTHYFTDVLGWPGFVSGQYTSTPLVLGRRRRGGPRVMAASSADDNASTNGITEEVPRRSKNKTNRPQISFFFRQLSLYLLSLLLMKVMVMIMFALFPFLYDFGRWVLDLFGERRRVQIFFVMALFPLAMNTLQFWLIDSVLRHNPNTSKYRSEEDDQATGGQNGDAENGQEHEEEEDEEEEDDEEDGEEVHGVENIGGPWTTSWWSSFLGTTGGKQDDIGRGRYQEVDRHILGDVSDRSDDDSEHRYPPRGSQSSSIAQLEPVKDDDENAVKKKKKSTELAYGATLGSPPLNATTTNGDQKEDDKWDEWSEDEETLQSTSDTKK